MSPGPPSSSCRPPGRIAAATRAPSHIPDRRRAGFLPAASVACEDRGRASRRRRPGTIRRHDRRGCCPAPSAAGSVPSARTWRSALRRRLARLAEPRERSRRVRVLRLRRLAPGRHLPDERHPRVQLAHPVDEAERLGGLGRARASAGSALARPSEELGEPAVRLEVAPDHHAVVRLERLRHPIDERPREPERIAHLADRRARPVRDEVADHPGVLRPVALVDVLDDLLAPLRAEVDVDVRVGRPALVDEPLEQQVVGDRLDPADPERVRHDRAGRAAPALGRDPLLLREAHQVPADQEELGEAGPLDDVELVGEPLDDRRRQRVVALPGAGLAQLDEVANGVSPPGTGKPGKRYCSKPRSTEHDAAISADVAIPSAQARAAVDRPQRARSPGGIAASSAPAFRYDSPSGRRRSRACRASGRGGSRPGRPAARGPPAVA